MSMEFHTGQSVVWPRSPDGVAQVEELRRSRLSLLYRRGARLCRVVVPAVRVARIQELHPLLPGFSAEENPLGRAIVRVKRKTFGKNG